jgi:hypothetical protein
MTKKGQLEVDVFAATGKKRPSHYKVICISLYTRDLEELAAKVAELKRRGWTKANKSELIRIALDKLDLDSVRIGGIR